MSLEMKKIFSPYNVTAVLTTLAFAGATAGLIVGALVVGSTVATVALAVTAVVAAILTLMSLAASVKTVDLSNKYEAIAFFQRDKDGGQGVFVVFEWMIKKAFSRN